ncbi:MAG: heme-binding protein [Cyanobacteria bacterium P01_E01_bin.42]
MKKFLLISGIVAIAVVGLTLWVYQANSAPLPEDFPPPTPDGTIEIKEYPPYRAASYRDRGRLSQAASRAFSPLFQHISANEISMTSPVEARYPRSTLEATTPEDVGETEVFFLYRNTDTNPENVASDIQIRDIPAMTVVSLGFRGGYDYENYAGRLARLQEWLEAHPEYEIAGEPRRFFYDGPFVPDALKRGEVQIPIRLRENN